MSFVIPDLPYNKDSLEPYIYSTTLDIHYNQHHKGYLNKLNSLIEHTDYQYFTDIQELITKVYSNRDQVNIFNNAAQVWNHSFYWTSMKKNGGGQPQDDSIIAKKIRDDLGGFQQFYELFYTYGINQFGSGWVWLILENGKLKITKSLNADLPFTHAQIPLLNMDVWEHAYYLDFQNRRIDYIKIFLEKLINWDFVEENLKRNL
ncbi:superoxide dismutase [Wolbachia endosymbiont of Howardula sp.]|uniref:superoxide dismutase n=1 Tax=Wolbachia endosymbiont of Howardula sp. TaxID=2916816 RepID=UPI00217E8251|nr:superoxide dismutase [Wolbachia endosymbiont of Howardula sp.]UWI83242.1 superoxide dismutase [Wolbachia endosymbiont of Howardula sp.]